MPHYTIPIRYNFNPDSDDGAVTEYFLPFSVRELNAFALDDFIKEALTMVRHESDYPLDEIARRGDPELLETLVELTDTELENQKTWNPYADDPEAALGFSLWDLYSEASLIFYASKNYKENVAHVNLLAGATVCSQRELLTLKVQLSLLLHFVREKYEKMADVPERGTETGTDLNNIYDVMAFYEAVTPERMRAGDLPDIIRRWYEELVDTVPEPGQTAFFIRDICALLHFNRRHAVDSVQYRNNWIAIKRLKADLLQRMWKPYSDAFHLDTAAKLVMNIIDKPKRRRNIQALRTLLGEDTTSAAAVMEHTRQNVRQFQNHAASICLVNYADPHYGRPEWDRIAAYFQDFPGHTTKIDESYGARGISCFALLITDGETHYFSMSGVADDLKQNYGCLAAPIEYVSKNILNRKALNGDQEFVYARIHPDLPVRRYTKFLSGKIADEDRSASYIYPDYVTFDQEFKSDPTITMGEWGSTYGCCERKLLAHSGYEHARTIFSRWAPCWKCCPAIQDASPVAVYAFAITAEYRDILKTTDEKPALPELKRYRVKRELRYCVEVIDQDENIPEQP